MSDAGKHSVPESALIASEALYRATFDQAALGIAHIGFDGRWLRVNDRLCAITGYTREELLGRRYVDITHPDDVPGNVALVESLREGRVPRIVLEKRYIHRDGSIVWVKVTAAVLHDVDGAPLHFISTLDDVTDRRQAETEARDNARRLRQALDGLPQIAWMTTRDGNAIYYNRRFTEYIGREIGPTLGDRMALVHPDDAERVLAATNRARAGETVFDAEARLQRHDGAWRWHRLHGVALDAPDQSGRSVLSIATGVDIHDMREVQQALAAANVDLERRVAERTRELTEAARELAAEMERREAAQAALLQSQKLEALGQLTGGVAHDLNNVLAAVSGSYELLRRRTDDPALLRLVALGEKGAERAAALVRQLLAFARREALQPIMVDPAALLGQIEALARHAVGPGVTCVLDAEKGVWPVLVDPQRMEMALLNLAVNARDAMPDGGMLTIAAANITEGGDHVAISVADTGIGMSAEVLARATEPFFTTKPPGKGTGLGLPSIRGFVEQSGGELLIASRPGAGTVVTIRLPRAEDRRARETHAPSRVAPSEPLHTGRTVLLADDDEQGRPVTAALLREMGFAVIEASDADTALGLARLTPRFDVLVTDVIMPGGDGPSLAAALRAQRPGLPVLFITGHSGVYRLEGEVVLAKPFTSRDLELRLRALCGAAVA